MANHAIRFEFADSGTTGVYKFRVGADPRVYVWFEYKKGSGALYVTSNLGPYRPEEDLTPAEVSSLDDLLAAHGTDREEWTSDLLAQFGERLNWHVG